MKSSSLFAPLDVGPNKLKHRIAMAPLTRIRRTIVPPFTAAAWKAVPTIPSTALDRLAHAPGSAPQAWSFVARARHVLRVSAIVAVDAAGRQFQHPI